MTNSKSDFTEVGALWVKEKNGKQFLSGKTKVALPAGISINIFKNNFKVEGDTKPDYTISARTSDVLGAAPAYNPEGPKKVIAAIQAPVQPVAPPSWDGDIPFTDQF